MNRLIKCIILCFIIPGLFIFSACRSDNYSELEEYCCKVNSIIKNIDFDEAKIEEEKIVLYSDKNVRIQEIPFEDYENKRIVAVRKEGDAVYFTISGSVDDEQGLVFINDDSNAILDGIKSIERIGGNSYWYSTSK